MPLDRASSSGAGSFGTRYTALMPDSVLSTYILEPLGDRRAEGRPFSDASPILAPPYSCSQEKGTNA